ncbi:ABC transporter ATP-binding protein [Anaerobacillus sp. CMMVII]|uniref:ABC transporter ATP-binding protein n=1 Tax=Anaerobacillus sp. CMMVII TaxID=2755588 RepID=UPI0021B7E7AD|nr:ABC transporter ATP-binding protein [Anaerobacillus sp. CMMVII]MCT8138140.1 ABC transporter ATP-binding protein [Anaerobacillus sp. CMMVII]
MKHIVYFLRQIHAYAGKILYINLLAMLFISLLDGVGILLLIPMISMSGLVDIDPTGTPLVGIFDFLQSNPLSVGLSIILGLFVLIVIGQNLLQRQIAIKGSIIQHGFFRHLRVKTYDALLHADWGFYIKNRKSDLIHLMTAEIARAGAGTHSFLQFLASLIFTCIQVVLAFWLSPTITTFVLASGLILLLFNRKFLKLSLELGNRQFTLGKNYLGGVTDQINGIKDIKSNTLEESRMQWFHKVTKSMEEEQIEYTRLKTKSQLYYKIASSVLIAGFIFLAVNLFNAQAAQLMLIIVIFSRLWPRVAGIQASLEQIATTIPALKAVIALQEECRNAREFTLVSGGAVQPLQVHRGMECRDVSFRYNRNESKFALKSINAFIPANQMTAVVGPSGAGKSTLIDLLMGLNQLESGELLIDGKPLTSSNLQSLRRAISYVPQDPFLFNESIRENLQLVAPNASEAEMWEALEFSSAAEFVRKLPEGLDTLIGDRGIRLSGGERQRIVLARAILRKPSILVLDEATSALDTENESKIQEALERLKGKMTIVVIAHRLSTIRNADQVVVLNEGEIIQQGGFNQLAKEKRSMFSNLLSKQMEVVHSQTST